MFLFRGSPDAQRDRGPDRSVGTQKNTNKYMSYVYILESIRDSRYYIGSTINLEKRLKHHKCGATPSTKRFGELKLVFQQRYNRIEDARYIERKLKKLKRKDYIRKIIEDGFIKI